MKLRARIKRALRRALVGVLPGEVLSSYRGPVIASGVVSLDAGITNAGLVVSDGQLVSIFKNSSYHFCEELGQQACAAHSHPNRPVQVVLYRAALDSSYEPTEIGLLSITLDGSAVDVQSSVFADARLLEFRTAILVFVSHKGNTNSSWIYFGALSGRKLDLKKISYDSAVPPQKNWVPFICDDRVFLEYSLAPHTVLELDVDSGRAVESASTHWEVPTRESLFLRGGAPAMKLKTGLYLGIGHSTSKRKPPDYRTFFYVFEGKPPFRVLRATRPLKLLTRSHRIQFVCGAILDEPADELVLSYGVCDCDNFISRFRLSQVLGRMKDV